MPIVVKHIDFLSGAPLRWAVASLVYKGSLPLFRVAAPVGFVYANHRHAEAGITFSMTGNGCLDATLRLLLALGASITATTQPGELPLYRITVHDRTFESPDMHEVILRATTFGYFGERVPVPDELVGLE